jgi:NAD(P)-dependent dehydrogenase (short-subunit alcohol dehydrogenase family)
MSETNTPKSRFQDQVIVITGAGGNFGREGCMYFANRGAKVVGMDLNPDMGKYLFLLIFHVLWNKYQY